MSRENPLGQAISLLERVRDRGVSSEILEQHFGAGCLSDLLEVSDPAGIDRAAHRAFLGLGPLDFVDEIDFDVIEVDFDLTIREMTLGYYDYVDREVMRGRFSVIGGFENHGKRKFRTRLFHFGRHISVHDIVAAMDRKRFTPARHEHGYFFGREFSQEPLKYLKYPIACIGSSVQVGSRPLIVTLMKNPHTEGRDLRTHSWVEVWRDPKWHFLGVQQVRDA